VAFAGGLLVLVLFGLVASSPRVAESIRHPAAAYYDPRQRGVGKAQTSQRVLSTTASVRFRSLQVEKQQGGNDVGKNDGGIVVTDRISTDAPVASPPTAVVSKGPGGAPTVGGAAAPATTPGGVDKGIVPGAAPVAAPISKQAPVAGVVVPAPSLAPIPATFAPVIRFDSSWQFPPSQRPIVAAPAPASSPTTNNNTTGGGGGTGGMDTPPYSPYVPTATPTAGDGEDGETTTSWTFDMTTDPPEFEGGLLVGPLEEYLPESTVVYNATDQVFTVTSPVESVLTHQTALRDEAALQRHFSQSGVSFTIETVQIQVHDNAAADAAVAPEPVVKATYSKRDIVLLIAFGISMTMIIGYITGLFCWKTEIDSPTELAAGTTSREWAYDKDKEEQLGVVDTLSSISPPEEVTLAPDEEEPIIK
jgi:hypothetical protein